MFRPRVHISILLAIGALLAPSTGAAQPTGDEVEVTLTGFSPWAAPDRPLAVALEVTNVGSSPLEEVAVRLTIRERVRSRSALSVALDREPQGSILAVTTESLSAPLAPGQPTPVAVQRDLGSLATAFLADRGISGVYPLTIQVQSGSRTLAERAGAFVFVDAPPETRINLIWAMPIHRPAALDASGVYNATQLARDLSEGGSVRGIVEMLERHPTAALTLAPTGQLADQLRDVSDGFEARIEEGASRDVPATDPIAIAAGELLARLRAAIASPAFEVVTMPYARADLTSLIAADMALDAGEQVLAGRQSVRDLLGRDPNPTVLANAGYRADTRSARTIAALGATVLLLDPAALSSPPEGRFGNPDRPEEVRASGQSFDALLVDAPIRERMQSDAEDPTLTAMGVLAETAVSYFEVPGLAQARSLVLATDSMPSPAVAGPLLDALAQAPWASLRTASAALADPALAPAGEPLRLGATPARVGEPLATAKSARRTLDVFGRVVDAPDRIAELGRRILISESADFTRPNRAGAYARAVRASAEATLAAITVPPRRVTLTSRVGRNVPVTIANKTGYRIDLRVRLDSAKAAFPAGATRRVSVEGNPDRQTVATVTFDLEARTAGSFPIDVTIETPDGDDPIGTGQLLVRSTAVSAVTFAATAGGLLFLLGAWVRRLIRRPKAARSG